MTNFDPRWSESERALIDTMIGVDGCVEIVRFQRHGGGRLLVSHAERGWPEQPFASLREGWLRRHPSEVNGHKLAFQRVSDSGTGRIELCETDWASAQSTQDAWAQPDAPGWRDAALRAAKEEHRFAYPNIAVVHVAVLTEDDHTVLSQRSSRVHYHPLHWSASFEEGLEAGSDATDMERPFENAVRRGMAEEFGLGKDVVSSARITPRSLILELGNGNPALVMIARVPIRSGALLRSIESAEGEIARNGVTVLKVPATGLGIEQVREALGREALMHPTSAYRLRELVSVT